MASIPRGSGGQVGEGYVALRLSQSKMAADLMAIRQTLQGRLGTAGTDAGRSFGTKFNSAVTDSLTSLSGAITKITMGALGGSALFAGYGVGLAAEMETATVAMTTMLGSGEKAKKLLSDLRDFANSTPFEFKELRGAAQSLVSMGVGAGDVIPTLKRLGDVSSGLNQPLGEIAGLYAQMRVQQTLYTQDLRQWTNRGVPLIQKIGEQFGKTDQEVLKMAEHGQLNFKHLERALVSLTNEGGMFFGLMDKQSKTLSGTWSTLKDQVSELALSIGGAFVPSLKLANEMLTQLVGTSDQAAKSITGGFGEQMVDMFKTVGTWAARLIEAFEFLGASIKVSAAGWAVAASEFYVALTKLDHLLGKLSKEEADSLIKDIRSDPRLGKVLMDAWAKDKNGAYMVDAEGRPVDAVRGFQWGQREQQWQARFDQAKKTVQQAEQPTETKPKANLLSQLTDKLKPLWEPMMKEIANKVMGHGPGELLAAGVSGGIQAGKALMPSGDEQRTGGFSAFQDLNRSIQETLLKDDASKKLLKVNETGNKLVEGGNTILKGIERAAKNFSALVP